MGDVYPAAHSMDTTWFAVDADGRIAQFDSGEDGAVPIKAASGGGAAEASFDVDALGAACTETRQPILFEREHGDDPGAYVRSNLPVEPLRLTDLPESIRAHVGELALPGDFTQQEAVHLADHLRDDEAHLWGDAWTLRDFGPPEPPATARVVPPQKRVSPVAVAVMVAIVAAIVGLMLR